MKLSSIFFFTRPINKIFIEPFGWVFAMMIVLYVPFLRPWWWVFLPLFLSMELEKLYLWWVNWDYNYATTKWAVLEIIPPKEILTPLKAMEDVFAVMWGPIYGPQNWREIWCEGGLADTPAWMSWEIASIEGKIHFYMRVMVQHRLTVETVLYSHYPNLEIHEVADYTRQIPQNIPNDEWDTYGEDFILGRPTPYPIKTYEKFFEPQGEKISAEEKRIDPIASLLELMSKIGPNEQYWLQWTTASVMAEEEKGYMEQVQEVLSKASKRPIPKKQSSFFDQAMVLLHNLVLGPKQEGYGEKATYSWLEATKTEEGEERELLLTPGEREVLTEVENKAKKPLYRTNIRGVYVAKRENFKPANKLLARSYFAHFQTANLNYLRFSFDTRPKTHYVFRKRIPFLRSRRMLRNYILRFPPFFPDRKRECPVLSTEELATTFHFPTKITGLASSTMAQVESKKGGAPPNLPT